jgi:hypothetical protein
MNDVMKEMVDSIIGILEWIDANVDNDDKFHHAGD